MTGTMPPVIRIDAVTKRFGDATAVNAVTLDIHDNEFLALLGASGCGKTTLLRLVAGFEHPDSGGIFIDGKDVTATAPYARPVNMMFQSYALFPHMTVAENVAFGLKQDGLQGEVLNTRVSETLEMVELPALAGRKPHQLSGGQRQRVALARCIAKRPRVLLLDEPMAALDKHLRERTQRELMDLRARLGITFVVVTHDQSEAMAMADRVAVMDAGRILQVAAPRDLYERPASRQVAQFFGDVNMWGGVVSAGADTIDIPALPMRFALQRGMIRAAGASVAVAVRPERVTLSRIPLPNAEHGLMGVVQQAVYMGTTSTYFVQVSGGGIVRAATHNIDDCPVFVRGESVHVSWSSAAVSVLDG